MILRYCDNQVLTNRLFWPILKLFWQNTCVTFTILQQCQNIRLLLYLGNDHMRISTFLRVLMLMRTIRWTLAKFLYFRRPAPLSQLHMSLFSNLVLPCPASLHCCSCQANLRSKQFVLDERARSNDISVFYRMMTKNCDFSCRCNRVNNRVWSTVSV